jgi:hypothetical protein
MGRSSAVLLTAKLELALQNADVDGSDEMFSLTETIVSSVKTVELRLNDHKFLIKQVFLGQQAEPPANSLKQVRHRCC